jgi:hypothetical protein
LSGSIVLEDPCILGIFSSSKTDKVHCMKDFGQGIWEQEKTKKLEREMPISRRHHERRIQGVYFNII